MKYTQQSTNFVLVFFTVFCLTTISGGMSLWLAFQPQLSKYQVGILEDSRATWQMGIGCIFGLLSNNAAQLLASKKKSGSEEE
ncbi:MAG: hypothetical protein RMZ43_015840 [Nostoc sp. CmiVER01]|uniref:hypothetical protein n=1 Tax=Nostoc sp. CmiVER01 TaxID=3075384 RepID=UPI002AD260DF|nr:hypothetical protein [Nostoc sp. CmiVER01]MDZ8122823.1 hypothetical protein [Nostoc sp. CmiVER01]